MKSYLRLSVFICGFCIFSSAALAQDALFTVPEPDPIARLLEPEAAETAPRTGKAALDLYMKNCAAQRHPSLDEERLISLCLCTAATMESRFSEEQILDMFGKSAKAQALRDSALRRAFAPCMPDIVRDIALSECAASPKALQRLQKKDAVCACTAQGMAATVSQKTEWLTDIYIKYYKDKAPDPLARYLETPALADDMQYNLTRCLRWHEYGWQTRKQ